MGVDGHWDSRIIDPNLFDFGGLTLTVGCVAVIACEPSLGWPPVALASLYPLVRWIRAPRRIRFEDIALLVFCLTAMIGAAVSYDPVSGWSKLRLVVSGALLYIAVSQQPRRNLAAVAVSGVLSVVAISMAFMMGEDWLSHPSGFAPLRQATIWWMTVRPSPLFAFGDRDLVGGALTLAFPFLLPLVIGLVLRRRWKSLAPAVIGAAICLICFVAITERGAVLGLSFAGLIVGYFVISGKLTDWSGRGRGVILILAMALGLAALIGFSQPDGGVVALLNRLPGSPSFGERWALSKDALNLALDTPFTGGGLGAFSGLYSRYALIIPVVYLTSSHNLYLDIAVEQGFLGLAALLAFWGASVAGIVRGIGSIVDQNLRWTRLAAVGALLALAIYGLVEDPFYDGPGLALLMLVPGVGIAFHPNQDRFAARTESLIRPLRFSRARRLIGTAILASAIGLVAWFQRPELFSSWYANWGAVAMAQSELRGWPDVAPGAAARPPDLSTAEALLTTAMKYDPNSVQARYRLGLIALDRRQFTKAVALMRPALQDMSNHRGLTKALGYAWLWEGNFDEATSLLLDIPEAPSELTVYAWWWGTQARSDLSHFAQIEAHRLSIENKQAP